MDKTILTLVGHNPGLAALVVELEERLRHRTFGEAMAVFSCLAGRRAVRDEIPRAAFVDGMARSYDIVDANNGPGRRGK